MTAGAISLYVAGLFAAYFAGVASGTVARFIADIGK